MATQIVMDHTGDTRHHFNADDTEALLKAEERFKALTSAGFTGGCSRCRRRCHCDALVRSRCRRNSVLSAACWGLI